MRTPSIEPNRPIANMPVMRPSLCACLLVFLPCISKAQETGTLRLTDALPGLTFAQPTCIASIPGDSTRLFVLEKGGLIHVVRDLASGRPSQSLFLDLTKPRDGTLELAGESGLLGLAFHPRFRENGLFFACYSLRIGGQLHQRLSRFKATGSDHAEPGTELPLVSEPDKSPYHNGGDVRFGPDGYLYFSTGDGGAGSGTHSGFIDRGFFSAIYRIDVDKRAGNLKPNGGPNVPIDAKGEPGFLVPADNPFIRATSHRGRPVNPRELRTETWATGLRNPWRFCHDAPSKRWFTGDVGEKNYEEIDLLQAGADYGWDSREGAHENPNWHENRGGNFAEPIFEYDHSFGNCVIGGIVYHGPSLPALSGAYLFADVGRGAICALREKDGKWRNEVIAREPGIVSFGTHPADGEALLVSIFSGKIKKLGR